MMRDECKRVKAILKKSRQNEKVNRLLLENWDYLRERLCKSENDCDYFNCTYLMMTYKYNENDDFNRQFMHHFRRIKRNDIQDRKTIIRLNCDEYADFIPCEEEEDLE